MGAEVGRSGQDGATRFPWAGPALFVAVALALLAFFVWFLGA